MMVTWLRNGYEMKNGLQPEIVSRCFLWRARQDSNLRPTDSKSGALSS
jgi:hypothetical protein